MRTASARIVPRFCAWCCASMSRSENHEIEEEQRARDDEQGEDAEEVVADARRRLMHSGMASGRVVRPAGCGDEPEEHEQHAAEQEHPERRGRPEAGEPLGSLAVHPLTIGPQMTG